MPHDPAELTSHDLDHLQRRSQLVAHVASAAVPGWFWPALGALIAVWVVSYLGGPMWGFGGALIAM